MAGAGQQRRWGCPGVPRAGAAVINHPSLAATPMRQCAAPPTVKSPGAGRCIAAKAGHQQQGSLLRGETGGLSGPGSSRGRRPLVEVHSLVIGGQRHQ